MKKEYQTPEIEFVRLSVNERLATGEDDGIIDGEFSSSNDPWA